MPQQVSDIRLSFPYPPETVTRANGGFGKDDTEVIDRWVELDEADGHCLLVDENHRPIGVIATLDETTVGVDMGPIVQGKQGGTAALTKMLGVTGDTKVVVDGGAAERGFVKAQGAPTTVDQVANRIGIILKSEATTEKTEGKATTRVKM